MVRQAFTCAQLRRGSLSAQEAVRPLAAPGPHRLAGVLAAGHLANKGGGEREDAQDRAIRPKTLKDYVGQPAVREQMDIFLAAAKARGEPLDHTLIFGPPGLGKTTLAAIVAHELGVSLKTTSGPVLEKAGDIAALTGWPVLLVLDVSGQSQTAAAIARGRPRLRSPGGARRAQTSPRRRATVEDRRRGAHGAARVRLRPRRLRGRVRRLEGLGAAPHVGDPGAAAEHAQGATVILLLRVV